MAEVTHFLELIRIVSFDGPPTVNWSCVIHQNRVFRVESGQRGCVAVAERLVRLFTNRMKLLNNLWIDGHVFFLAKCRQSKTDCQSCKGDWRADLHYFLPVSHDD